MNAQIETGGPAFPTESAHQSGQSTWHFEGMTLRDYFAAKALPSVYSAAIVDAAGGSGLFSDPDWRVGLALDTYAMADAMLKARAAGNTEGQG